MIALIDSDIVAYRSAASCKDGDNLDIALLRVDQLMRDILQQTKSDSYIAHLSGSENYRKHINPEYKANRKDMVPPQYLQDCREYLVTEWKAKISHGVEADDMLGIDQGNLVYTSDFDGMTEYDKTTVICSIDKDLKMIPGLHYNFVKQEWDEIDQEQADKHFWKQMLIGDKVDNIIGVQGLGPVKSARLIDPCYDNQDCFETVLEKYQDDFDRFVMNANCLWIKRSEESTWLDLRLTLPSELQQKQDEMSKSMRLFIQSI